MLTQQANLIFNPAMTDSNHELLALVERYLADTGTKSTEFGRAATGDPSLVLGLRRGRSPRLRTVDRVVAYMRANGMASAALAFLGTPPVESD